VKKLVKKQGGDVILLGTGCEGLSFQPGINYYEGRGELLKRDENKLHFTV